MVSPLLLVAALTLGSPQRHDFYPDDGQFVQSGEHYEVHVHYADKPALIKALDVCERAWPHTMELLSMDDEEIQVEWPPALHVYPSKEEYVDVEALLTRGAFRDNESFSHWNTRTAHVALAPPLPREARAEVLLSAQCQEVIAHEAAHLAVYSVIPSYRFHPTWLGEGLALSVELSVARELGLVDDPSEHPRFSTNQLRARRLLEEDRVPAIGSLLMDALEGLSTAERYALWHEFIEILQEDRTKFRRLIEVLRQTRGGPEMRRAIADHVLDSYGEKTLERRLRKRLEKLAPAWEQVYRSLDTSRDQWLQTAFPELHAIAWRIPAVQREAFQLEGTLTPLSSDMWMAVLVGRDERSHFAVRFHERRLEVLLVEGDSSRELASAPIVPISRGVPLAFRVVVDGRALRIELDGLTHLEASLPRDARGGWGLSVSKGSAGRWGAVELDR